MSHRVLLRAVVMISPFVLASAAQAVDPSKIYLYNRIGDNFDFLGLAYIGQQMGWVDANGTLGDVRQNGDIVIGNQTVAKVTFDQQGSIINYKNPAGTIEAHDVRGKNLDVIAFKRIADAGDVTMNAHGLVRIKEQQGMRRELKGGAMLIGENFRPGFKSSAVQNGGGTGVTGDAVFPIEITPPAQNRSFSLTLNTCYGSNDPDGAGDERAVTTSAGDVPRVNPISSHQGVVTVGADLSIIGGTDEQKSTLFTKVQRLNRRNGQIYSQAQATADGFGELSDEQRDWVAFHRYWQRQSLERQRAIQNALVSGDALLRATYTFQGAQRGGTLIGTYEISMPGLYTPYTSIEPLTSDSHTLSFGESSRGAAEVTIGPGDLFDTTMFHIKEIDLPLVAPGSQPYLVSGVFDFRADPDAAAPLVAGELDYEFELSPEAGSDATIYYLGLGGWEPLASSSSDGRVFTTDARVGIYAAFSTVPAPGPVGLVLAGVLVAVRRRRV